MAINKSQSTMLMDGDDNSLEVSDLILEFVSKKEQCIEFGYVHYFKIKDAIVETDDFKNFIMNNDTPIWKTKDDYYMIRIDCIPNSEIYKKNQLYKCNVKFEAQHQQFSKKLRYRGQIDKIVKHQMKNQDIEDPFSD